MQVIETTNNQKPLKEQTRNLRNHQITLKRLINLTSREHLKPKEITKEDLKPTVTNTEQLKASEYQKTTDCHLSFLEFSTEKTQRPEGITSVHQKPDIAQVHQRPQTFPVLQRPEGITTIHQKPEIPHQLLQKEPTINGPLDIETRDHKLNWRTKPKKPLETTSLHWKD